MTLAPANLIERRGETFKAKRSTIRALTYLPNGQRCECWLPAGEWTIDGACNVYKDRDNTEMVGALIVWNKADVGTWYIGLNAV